MPRRGLGRRAGRALPRWGPGRFACDRRRRRGGRLAEDADLQHQVDAAEQRLEALGGFVNSHRLFLLLMVMDQHKAAGRGYWAQFS